MKKKYWKLLALIVALAMIVCLAWFANSLLGNPISKWLATNAAQEYLAETYAGTDFYIEKLGFSFKTIAYYAHIKSPTSIDTQFTLYIDMWGNLYWDTYADVLSGAITARRLDQAYRELTDTLFESSVFPYDSRIGYGTLEIYPREAIDNPDVTDIPDYAIVQEDLVVDQIYDIPKLGAQAGHLIVYIDLEAFSVETAAEILLDIREEFDNAGIPFHAIDLTLQYPLPEEGPRPDEYIGVNDFLYDDIYEEGLEDRVLAAFEALQAYYAMLDAK